MITSSLKLVFGNFFLSWSGMDIPITLQRPWCNRIYNRLTINHIPLKTFYPCLCSEVSVQSHISFKSINSYSEMNLLHKLPISLISTMNQCTWCIAQSTMNIIYLPVLFYCSKNHQKSAPYHYKSLQIITTRKSASWRWLSGLLNLTSASISDWTTMREATRNDQVLVFIHTFYILIGIAHAFYRWYCTISGVRTTVTLFEGIEHMFYTCQTVT